MWIFCFICFSTLPVSVISSVFFRFLLSLLCLDLLYFLLRLLFILLNGLQQLTGIVARHLLRLVWLLGPFILLILLLVLRLLILLLLLLLLLFILILILLLILLILDHLLYHCQVVAGLIIIRVEPQ